MVALYTRVHHDTLVNISDEYMGFQSALHNPTVAHVYEHEGSPYEQR
jgi:hypothetical protein